MAREYTMREFKEDLKVNSKLGVFTIPKEMLKYSKVQRNYEGFVFVGFKHTLYVDTSFSIGITEEEANKITDFFKSHLKVVKENKL